MPIIHNENGCYQCGEVKELVNGICTECIKKLHDSQCPICMYRESLDGCAQWDFAEGECIGFEKGHPID